MCAEREAIYVSGAVKKKRMGNDSHPLGGVVGADGFEPPTLCL